MALCGRKMFAKIRNANVNVTIIYLNLQKIKRPFHVLASPLIKRLRFI